MQRRRWLASTTLLIGKPCAWATSPWQTALARAQARRDAAVSSGDQPYGAVVVDPQGVSPLNQTPQWEQQAVGDLPEAAIGGRGRAS